MERVMEFVSDIKPLLKSSLPDMMQYLDGLERDGMFQLLRSTRRIRSKIADSFSEEDFDQIAEGMVTVLEIIKRLGDPKVSELLRRTIDLVSRIDVKSDRKPGPASRLVRRFVNGELVEGLGVVLLFAGALGKLRKGETEWKRSV